MSVAGSLQAGNVNMVTTGVWKFEQLLSWPCDQNWVLEVCLHYDAKKLLKLYSGKEL